MVIAETKSGEMTDRVKKVREEFLNAKPVVSTERLKFVMEAYKETEGEPPVIRRAVLMDKQLRGKEIFIDENPLAGTLTKYPVGAEFYPEWSPETIVPGQEFATSLGDTVLPKNLPEEDIKLIEETMSYWRDKCTVARTKKIWSEKYPEEDVNDLRNHKVWFDTSDRPPHRTILDYEKVLNIGLKGVIKQAEDRLREVPIDKVEGQRQRQFLSAVILVLEAVIAFAQRYATLAHDMARKETDPQRMKELEEIADICNWVPANPARTFREAVQSFWFIHLVEQMVQTGPGFSPGRLAKYMYPIYKKDRDEGRLTEEEAIELLQFLFIRLTSITNLIPAAYFRGLQGNLFQNLSIGGINADGSDATNELDFLVLEAQKQVRMIQPTITVLYHNTLSEDFMLKAAEVIKTGIGMPAIVNNDVCIERLLNFGVPLEESRNGGIAGCLESGIVGTMAVQSGPYHNMPKLLELALNNGWDPVQKKQIGPQTGDARKFESYEQLYKSYVKQHQYFNVRCTDFQEARMAIDAEFIPAPFASALVDDCIERGMDIHSGGARYYLNGHVMTGMINLADSLAAIKKLVYDEKSVTMDELLKALEADFEGYEELYKKLIDAPKYGNDDEYVDSITRELYDMFYEEHQKFTDHLGKKRMPIALSATAHFGAGLNTGALPCGRKARLPLVDGGVSPAPGMDRNGPTALLKSAAKVIDNVKYNASQLNMKFHPTALKDRSGLKNLIALIRTYMDLGGYHVQFNVVSADTLKDAQIYPENYRDLIVRVAGFSAYYVHLETGVQNEIIKRTELTL